MAQIFGKFIANQLGIPLKKVENTVSLFEEGATIPFIARYRKEATGSLDEVEIADIFKALNALKEIEKRKETILKTIQEQGKLTAELRKEIDNCWDATRLEDIYLPYKPKRKTKGSVARENGLEPLAAMLFKQKIIDIASEATKYLNENIPDIEAALAGARDIIAEWINEDASARQRIRFVFEREAQITSKVARGKQEEAAKYRDYFEFSEPLKKCPSHRLLAIRRGENEGFLRVSIAPEPEEAVFKLEQLFLKENNAAAEQIKTAIQDAYKRLLQPSIETEFRSLSKAKADQEAIDVFVKNLRQLLLSAPLGQRAVLGIDPGFRTGCKVVCLNERGDLLYNTAIYPHPPQNNTMEAAMLVEGLIEDYKLEAIAIGNGTAGRETMDFCKGINFNRKVELFMVNEAGASIYSASEIAREEFPKEDLTVRGAVSIGRRLMDPLAELVKIDPKSIGVGQYQHDVNQTMLKESLGLTVESCVNSVGININTASKHLLNYVSGLGPSTAAAIVNYRSENGAFTSRKELKKVPRLGAKAFQQCAGFLRIRNAKNPLDNTAVHPETYAIVQQMAKDLGVDVQQLIDRPDLRKGIQLSRYVNDEIGIPTLKDIIKELDKPGLDPRGEVQVFEFANIHGMEDLEVGMVVPGIVTNLTNFGAFVDIGVKQDGLVHVSQIANKFVKNPADELDLNQKVQVKIMEVDIQRKRINLSIKQA